MKNKKNSQVESHYVTLVLLAVILVMVAVLYHSIVSQQQQISILNENYLELRSDLDDLAEQVKAPNDIYGFVQDSVVEVKTVIQVGIPFGVGSGFIYDSEGHIITNAHVIDEANRIEVTFSDGTISNASLIGLDKYSDLAVIKVDEPKNSLKPVVLGDSTSLNIGDPIYVVGSPYELGGSMTSGIVSQLHRVLPSEGGYLIVGMIQVDAAVNPGNSGGPLLNFEGEVVGVNTAIISRTGEFTGVGFAIPSQLVTKVVPSLIADGVYRHPWLGISGYDVTPDIARIMNIDQINGVLVTSVIQDSPADKAGIIAGNETVFFYGFNITVGGDIIVDINSRPVKDMRDLLIYLEYNTVPDDIVTLNIIRESEELSINVKLGERPLPD